jgi:flagellar biosynthetic protein FliP
MQPVASIVTAVLLGLGLALAPVQGLSQQPSDVAPRQVNPPSAEDPPANLMNTSPIPQLVLPGSMVVSTGDDASAGQTTKLDPAFDFALGGPERWTSPEGLSGSLQILLLLTVLSLAPAILLMTTCYVRIIVVLGLMRQAIGLPSLPPGQVMTSIALFMTLFVMAPVWNQVYTDAIEPYTDPAIQMSPTEAFEAGAKPLRDFMARQIHAAGNHEDVVLFAQYADPGAPPPQKFGDVPIRVLLPAYMLSELKTAFLMGFQIYLPFLIVDLVVASVTISMGMLMLPPSVISLPFKLLLFVLVDGWRSVVEMLLISFGTSGPV